MVEWDGIAGTMTSELNGSPAETYRSAQTRDDMFLTQAQAFLNAGRGIPDPRLATGADGLKALALCDAARRSTGKWEKVR